MNDYEATFQQFQLEAQTFGAQTRIPASVAASMKFEEVRDLMRDDLIHSVRGFIYGQSRKGETITRTAQVRTPDGWWQHFKECAIRDGNPFFDPAKVRYRYRTATLTVDPAEFRWWPYADLPVPEHWGAPIRLALPPQISWKVEASDCYGTNERAHRRCIYCAAASAPSFCFAPLTSCVTWRMMRA